MTAKVSEGSYIPHSSDHLPYKVYRVEITRLSDKDMTLCRVVDPIDEGHCDGMSWQAGTLKTDEEYVADHIKWLGLI